MDAPADPITLVDTAVRQALAITEPTERARIISRLFAAIDAPELKRAREADIRALRKTHTLAALHEMTGLSISRIDQIATGRVTGRRAPRASE